MALTRLLVRSGLVLIILTVFLLLTVRVGNVSDKVVFRNSTVEIVTVDSVSCDSEWIESLNTTGCITVVLNGGSDYRIEIVRDSSYFEYLIICGHEFRHVQLFQDGVANDLRTGNHHKRIGLNGTISLKPETYRFCRGNFLT